MIRLREYQKNILKQILKNFDKKIQIIQAPTGAGKSIIMTKGLQYLLHNKQDDKALIISPRLEINDQLEQYLIDLKIDSKCKIITNLNRKIFEEIHNYQYVIYDEAHHAQCLTCKKIKDATNNDCKLFYFTATPMAEKLIKIENKICGLWGHLSKNKNDINYIQCEKQTKQLIKDGNLSKFQMIPCYDTVAKVIEQARKIKSVMIREQSFTQIVGMIPYYKILQALQHSKIAVAFCNSIAYCVELKKYLIENGINAELLVSDLDNTDIKQDRKKIVSDFKNGKIKVLLGVNIFNEGFDCPIVDTALMLRPTNSLIIYLQQIGRVLRPSITKDITLIFDFVGNGAYFGAPDSDWQWKKRFWLEKDPKEKTLMDKIPMKTCPVCGHEMSGNAVRECPYCHFDFYKWNVILGKQIYLRELWKKLEKSKNNQTNEILLNEKCFIKQTKTFKGLMLHLFVKNENFWWCFYSTNKFKHQEMLRQINEICEFSKPLIGLNGFIFYKCKNKIIRFCKKDKFNVITNVRDLMV